MSFMKMKWLILTLLLICEYSLADGVINDSSSKPKNIILFIGDGMGPSYIKAFRLFKDDPKTQVIENTVFDDLFVGVLRTDPARPYGKVTDSAAAATAMSTGIKTYFGAVGVDVNKKPLLTVLERAKQLGLSTGLIATSSLSHATPASFASHHENRREERAIVKQYVDRRYKGMPYVDVLLGGGKKFFIGKNRNVIQEFQSLGYQFVENKKALNENKNTKLLGLFAENAFEKMFDKADDTPTLAEMTQAAIKQLSKNDKGFFLMVEGSQIDFAGHRQDIVGVMSEMQGLEDAILVAKNFANQAENKQNTQILITADHSTGGLSVGNEVNGKKHYEWNAQALKYIKYTPKKILANALESHDFIGEFSKATGFELTVKEVEILKALNFEKYANQGLSKLEGDYKKTSKLFEGLCQIISDRSFTGWTTHGHTGEDVFLYAYGPASDELRGGWENTKIGKTIFNWLEK